MRPQKLETNPTYESASRGAVPKRAPDLPKRPIDQFIRSLKFFYNIFHKKSVIRTGKNGSASFHSRPPMKVALTGENGRNTSNTGSKVYV